MTKRVTYERHLPESEPRRFAVYTRYKIACGLSGIKGTLLEQDYQKNFLIELSQIGYTLRMEVKSAWVRKVERAEGQKIWI